MFTGNKVQVHESAVIHVNDDSFHSEVIQSNIPVLVDFWAPWCGPCRILGPVLDTISNELDGKVKVVKVNVDENPKIAGALQIQAIPMLAVFKEGNLLKVAAGVRPKQEILALIETAVNKQGE